VLLGGNVAAESLGEGGGVVVAGEDGGVVVAGDDGGVVAGEDGGVVAGEDGGVVAGEDGGVVAGGCCARVTGRLPPPTPDEKVNRPANTRTVNVAAAITAAPMTPAPTTKALCIVVRLSSRRDARRSALVRRRPSAYPDEPRFRLLPRGSASGSVRARKSSSRWVTFPVLRATASSPCPPFARRLDPERSRRLEW
jgi:hypothetical protein